MYMRLCEPVLRSEYCLLSNQTLPDYLLVFQDLDSANMLKGAGRAHLLKGAEIVGTVVQHTRASEAGLFDTGVTNRVRNAGEP